jgi:uncharacterized protein (DUF2384 family)
MKTESTIPPHLTELYALALETFGSESKANAWLHRDNLALGTTPIAMAASESGLNEVKKILSAISYGGVV